MNENITLKIDNREISVPKGTTILEAARELGIDIPTLCMKVKAYSVFDFSTDTNSHICFEPYIIKLQYSHCSTNNTFANAAIIFN